MLITYSILALLIAAISHEGGHFLAALCFGHMLNFRLVFAFGIVPRGVWDMPDDERWKQRVIALAGFGMELVIVPPFLYSANQFFGAVYHVIACAHLLAYSRYAGEYSDFQWL